MSSDGDTLDSLRKFMLEQTKQKNRFSRRNRLDEIVSGLYVGDCSAATSLECLHVLGITHVLNAAEGIDFNQIMTGHAFYEGTAIIYHGISADDKDTFDLQKHFEEAANFIRDAIGTKDHPKGNAKILVHCMAGVSRSATFAAAYLMRDHKLNVREALRTMLDKRVIFPNDGFFKMLAQLQQTAWV
ncbi:dual specificity protein phosphatase 3-like [Rhopilema esculentum]|uniref:dual specificity protein phosphatase 3-like n=1 Tax=Rhopilema esculentum TaxID=499914 RepID=UPI0031D214CD